MKKIFGFLTAALIFVAARESALAREGTLSMSSSNVSCQGVSVWQESNYRVTGRCQGLVYPYATQYEHYSLWAKLDNGNTIRVDDIDRGYFEGNVQGDFADFFITAETSSSPRRPSDKTIVSGKVAAFDFGKTNNSTVVATPAPTATPVANSNTGTMTVQNAATSSNTTSTGIGSVIGQILKALLVIVGVIIAIAVGASLLFRKRGSVSA